MGLALSVSVSFGRRSLENLDTRMSTIVFVSIDFQLMVGIALLTTPAERQT